MNQAKKVLLAISLFLSSGVVTAHPGHGSFTGNEVAHYLTSPVHIGVGMVALVLAIILISKRISKRV